MFKTELLRIPMYVVTKRGLGIKGSIGEFFKSTSIRIILVHAKHQEMKDEESKTHDIF